MGVDVYIIFIIELGKEGYVKGWWSPNTWVLLLDTTGERTQLVPTFYQAYEWSVCIEMYLTAVKTLAISL